MAFWTEKALEPKRQYRFTLTMGQFSEMKFMVKKVNKPALTIEGKTHNYLNHEFHYPGRPKWNEIEATIIDAVAPDASYRLSEILKESGYIVPKNSNEVTTISKAAAATSLGAVVIEQYGPGRESGTERGIVNANDGGGGIVVGDGYDSYGSDMVIEKWTLNNPFITSINFGNLDYANEEMVEIVLKFRYDWATITAGDAAGNPATIWS